MVLTPDAQFAQYSKLLDDYVGLLTDPVDDKEVVSSPPISVPSSAEKDERQRVAHLVRRGVFGSGRHEVSTSSIMGLRYDVSPPELVESQAEEASSTEEEEEEEDQDVYESSFIDDLETNGY